MSASGHQLNGRRTIVVVGATSDVGVALSARLEQAGHCVRRVARSLGISLADQRELNNVFQGADSAYVMIPFDLQAPDLHAVEREAASRLAEAITTSGVGRILLLSGLNAHLKMGTSWGAAHMEERLEALGISNLAVLRAGFFNENFVKGMGFVEQAETGVFATPFDGDRPMPLIAASDIGEHAADILMAHDWPTTRVIELHGGSRLPLVKATEILGRAIGRPLVYQCLPEPDARAAMVSSGLSSSFVEAVIETAASFNRGERWALEAPAPRNTTRTTLEVWAERVLGARQQAVGV